MAKGADFEMFGKTWNDAERVDKSTIRLVRWVGSESGNKTLVDICEAPISMFSGEELDVVTPYLTDCSEYAERKVYENRLTCELKKFGFETVGEDGWSLPEALRPATLRGRAWGFTVSDATATLLEDGYILGYWNNVEDLKHFLGFMGLKEK